MEPLRAVARHRKNIIVVALLSGLLPVLAAIIAEKAFDILPCHMCYLERWPYIIVVFLAIFSKFKPSFLKIAIEFMILAYGVGIVLSLYHLGIEYGFMAGSHSCGGDIAAFRASSIEDLETYLKTVPTRRCDQAPKLFGLVSFALLNLFYSFLAFLYCVIARRSVISRKFT